MTEQELNKKLAEWAGFTYKFGKEMWNYERYKETNAWWEAPNGRRFKDLPDFTQSLDACFKWIVPKVIDKIMAEQECSSDLAYAVLFKKWLQKLELDIPNHEGTLFWAIWEVLKR